MLISIIIPCFNEEKVLESTYQRLSAVLAELSELKHSQNADGKHETFRSENPKGIPSSSPGLRGTSYPGLEASALPLPRGEGWGEGEGTVRQPIAREAAQPTVHGKHQRSTNLHCDPERPLSSPSPPPEERAGERRPLFSAQAQAQTTDYELLFVDDGSRDSTPAILKNLSEKDRRVTVIRFSRNFGHQPAVSAGLQHCRGDLAVIIDADLQDPPEVIPNMLEQLKAEKANVVYGVRKRRNGETWFKLVTAKIFYQLLNKLSDVPMPLNTGDFRLVDRKVVNAFNALPENTKYIRGLISWMGFKQIPFYYEREARFAGSTKYSLTKMIRFASTGIFYFSKKPLQIATAFGFLSVAAGLLLSAWILFNKLTNPQFLISGWTSLVLAVIYFGGVQLLTIGILGQYVGNLFDEVKRRPEYIIDEIVTRERASAKNSEMYFPLSVEPLVKEDQKIPPTSPGQKSYVATGSGG
jgi:polyisoprenyl-phosphate glycosyltransferase